MGPEVGAPWGVRGRKWAGQGWSIMGLGETTEWVRPEVGGWDRKWEVTTVKDWVMPEGGGTGSGRGWWIWAIDEWLGATSGRGQRGAPLMVSAGPVGWAGILDW